jgi:hypothetical protein
MVVHQTVVLQAQLEAVPVARQEGPEMGAILFVESGFSGVTPVESVVASGVVPQASACGTGHARVSLAER